MEPHDSAYAHNEAQMLDWQGDMVAPNQRQTIDLHEVQEDPEIAATCYIGRVETQAVVAILDEQESLNTSGTSYVQEELEYNTEIASVLNQVNPLLTDESLCKRLMKRNELSQFQIAIGSTNASEYGYVIHDDEHNSADTSIDESTVDEDVLLNTIFQGSNEGTFNIDDIMVSAIHAGRHQGVKAKRFGKDVAY